MLESLADVVNADTSLVRRGRFVHATMLWDLGDERYEVRIDSGHVVSVEQPHVMATWTFAVRAPLAEWQLFWLADPPPGSHDLLALMRRQVAVVEGNLHPFMANLMYFKGVLAAPREGAK